MGAGKVGNFGNTKGSSLDALSTLLAAASFVPGLDTFTNLASIPVDLARGDFTSAGLSALGVIPVIGEAGDAAKVARIADKAMDASKTVSKVDNVRGAIKTVSPSKLTPTHKITKSKNQFKKFAESVSKNGITEPIKYVEFNGTKYVVDGHHRLKAAKQFNMKSIPIEEVSLPYKGYKTIGDLLWFE